MMEATIIQIKHLRVDALYGKKKHFNAADRKERNDKRLNIPVLVINVVLSSILLISLQKEYPEIFKWIAAALSIVATILSSFVTYLKLPKKVEGHRRVANKYLALVKRSERLLAYEKDKYISKEELIRKFEEIANAYEEINQEAEALSTNDDDYSKAKKGIQSGEEDYLSNELNS